MTVVPMVKKQSDKRGWLWRRSSETEPWTKVFAILKASQLSLFRDDKDTQPSEVLHLSGSAVQDLGTEAGKPPGRSSRVLCLQVPTAESEELRSLLPQCGLPIHAHAQSLQLAAPDSSEYTQWLKLLKQASTQPQLANSIVVDEERVVNGFKPKATSRGQKQARPLDPPVAVSAFLCAPNHPERDFLPVLGRARAALKDGLLNLGGAREEARRCQFALNSVRRQMRDLDLSLTHRPRAPEEISSELMVEVREWLEQALSLMSDIDRSLENLQMKDAPFAPEWETFAHDTMLKLQAMEEALRLGLYASRHAEALKGQDALLGTAKKNGSQTLRRVPAVTPPAAPYSHYKYKHSL